MIKKFLPPRVILEKIYITQGIILDVGKVFTGNGDE